MSRQTSASICDRFCFPRFFRTPSATVEKMDGLVDGIAAAFSSVTELSSVENDTSKPHAR
jgi:hypothetical protein